MELESLETHRIVRKKDLNPESVNALIDTFENVITSNLTDGMELNFDLELKSHADKKVPYLKIAQPHEAKQISEIFQDAYKGTYPYKEMVDEKELRKMIEDPNFHWILFKSDTDTVMGCYGFHTDFKAKSGTFHGFALKNAYQTRADALKIIIGCMYGILSMFKDQILVWSCEIRTAHSISQYMGSICGLYPVAFFPNKDVFFNRLESSLLFIMYDEKAFEKYRSKEVPNIILQAAYCYLYSRMKYNLTQIRYRNPEIALNYKKVNELNDQIHIKTEQNYTLSYQKITFSLKNSESYFTFLFAPHILNCEKTEYRISSLEELYVFILRAKSFIKKFRVRYFECFVSAYRPLHQKLFADAGFAPRGYVPCWKYNHKTQVFEDYIAFNYFKGKVDNLQLIPESLRLLSSLNFFVGLDSTII